MRCSVYAVLLGCLLPGCSSPSSTEVKAPASAQELPSTDPTLPSAELTTGEGLKSVPAGRGELESVSPSEGPPLNNLPSEGNKEPPKTDALEVIVHNVASLRAALSQAVPGQRILLAPGTYAPTEHETHEYAGANRPAYFQSARAGTQAAPITLESADPTAKAELVGLHTDNAAYVLWIRGEHWKLQNLILRRGGKGLMLDEASHAHVSGVEVYEMRDEGIHLRSGTSHALVENCIVDGTGIGQPGFGEGVYVGSDHSQWHKFPSACDNNIVRSCVIRNVTAEALDIKEGTTGTVVEGCEIYGGQVSGENSSDSLVDLKGDSARVHSNTFYRENNQTVTRGVAIVIRPEGPTGTNNWVFGNTYHMDTSDGLMVHAYAGRDNHAWDNTRLPEGEEYNGKAPELHFEDPR